MNGWILSGGAVGAIAAACVPLLIDMGNRVSERDRILSAYERAWKAWSTGGGSGTDEQLLEAMRNEGVPSIYSEPHDPLVYEALERWRQRDSPKDLRRIL